MAGNLATMPALEPEYEDIHALALRPRLKRFLDIWDGARRGLPVPPAKSRIDPVDLGRAGLLPFIWLVEMDAQSRFVFRLAGEEIISNFTCGIRRRMLGDLFDPETAEQVGDRYRQVIEAEHVEYSSGPVTRGGISSYYARRLLVPLRDDDGRTVYVMGVVDKQGFDRFKPRHGSPRYSADRIVVTPVHRLADGPDIPEHRPPRHARVPELVH